MAEKTAFAALTDILNRADKTIKQAEQALNKKGYSAQEIADAIQKAEEFRFLNDREYAARYVFFKRVGKGKFRIVQELKEKGLEEPLIEEALKTYTDSKDICLQVAERFVKAKTWDIKLPEKLLRHLVYKGFSYDEAKDALTTIKSGLKDSALDEDETL